VVRGGLSTFANHLLIQREALVRLRSKVSKQTFHAAGASCLLGAHGNSKSRAISAAVRLQTVALHFLEEGHPLLQRRCISPEKQTQETARASQRQSAYLIQREDLANIKQYQECALIRSEVAVLHLLVCFPHQVRPLQEKRKRS
jgi:hypothetical protein